jgi:prepilin-type N-terminal cleavage/methylation domain-containing protein
MRSRSRCRLRLRLRSRAGFTLVEIFVVLIILGVMAAVAAPAFRSPPDEDDLTYATHQIEGMLKLARDSAVRGSTTVTLVIDSATARAWLVGSFSAEAAGEEVRTDIHASDLLAGLQLGEPIALPPGVRLQLSKTRARFAFGPAGAAFADSIELRSVLGNRLITIDPWTGDVID